MKRAKQIRQVNLKSRNPVLVAAILRKGGVHQRGDKKASRARQRERLRKDLAEN